MLPALSNVPHTEEDWKFWSWNHRDSHDRIRKAIKKKYHVSLSDYQVEPINPNDFASFLQNNSALHDDMNSALGLQSSDLQDAKLEDPNEAAAWIRLHSIEHYYAESKLGASIV